MAPIISQRLFARMEQFFPSKCTLRRKVQPIAKDGYGQEIIVWEDVPELVDLPCAVGPIEFFSGAIERRLKSFTSTERTWHILIPGHYPEITTSYQAVVDETVYNIYTIEEDQTKSITRLWVNVVEV